MSDIVERLRDYKERFIFQGGSKYAHRIADEIENLRTRVAELETQLQAAQNGCNAHLNDHIACLDRLAALKESQQAAQAGRFAMEHFHEANGDSEPDPVERLRFYCSLAMQGQDWLDVEPFFDALKAGQGEPVFIIFNGPPDHNAPQFIEVETADGRSVGLQPGWHKYPEDIAIAEGLWRLGPLYTQGTQASSLAQPPTIPEGWLKRGLKELNDQRGDELPTDEELLPRLLKAMLSAAPQPTKAGE